MTENIQAFWGFSLLRYIQKEFNSGFDQDDLIPRYGYIPMPKGGRVDGVELRGFVADYSMLPRVILPDDGLRERAQRGVADKGKRGRRGEGRVVGEIGYEIEGSVGPREWVNFLVGPDIFLSEVAGVGRKGPEWEGWKLNREGGVLEESRVGAGAAGSGIGRRLVGIEYFDYPLAYFDGVLKEEEIRVLGDAVMAVDEKLKLRGKFVEILWNISQFTRNCDRNALVMKGAGAGGSRGKGVMAVSFGMDVLRGDYKREKVVSVPMVWCDRLYSEFDSLYRKKYFS